MSVGNFIKFTSTAHFYRSEYAAYKSAAHS